MKAVDKNSDNRNLLNNWKQNFTCYVRWSRRNYAQAV